MYDAIKPVYTKLFEIIDNRFGPVTRGKTTIERDSNHIEVFKHLDRGWGRLTESNVTATQFPYGSLDWGEISEVKEFRAPHGYEYRLTYPLIIITHEGIVRAAPETTIKTFRDEDTERYGIGDVVSIIGSYMFKSYKDSRFRIAETEDDEVPEGLDPWQWTIIDWTQDVCDCRYQPAMELLTKNPLCRGTQINFHFRVNETKPTL